MAEGLKALIAVIGPHAAGPDAPKGEVLLGDVHDDVVHGHPPGGGAIQQRPLLLSLLAEIVQT